VTTQSNIFFKDGYDKVLQNSKTLSQIADNAALKGAFGIACSLNILSAEEALKASFLIIQYYNPDGKINEFDKIFYKHTVKHDQLKQYVEFQNKMQLDLKEYIKIYLPLVNLIKQMSLDFPQQRRDEINELEEDLKSIKKLSEINLNIDGILDWLENANNDKNRGFYVDKLKNNWITPKDISKEKYETEKIYTDALISYVINIEQMFILFEKAKNSELST
jgi:AbiV family abortive infection protein